MFQFNDDQFELLEKPVLNEFRDSIISYINSHHPYCVVDLDVNTILARVEFGIQQAQEYDMDALNSITLFVVLMFEYAPDFNNQRAIHSYLVDKNVRPNTRIWLAVEELPSSIWEEVKHNKTDIVWCKNNEGDSEIDGIN